MTDKEKQDAYNSTCEDVFRCCINWKFPVEEVDGICPKCGRATAGGVCICGCEYSPVVCECCGARPCDGSC